MLCPMHQARKLAVAQAGHGAPSHKNTLLPHSSKQSEREPAPTSSASVPALCFSTFVIYYTATPVRITSR